MRIGAVHRPLGTLIVEGHVQGELGGILDFDDRAPNAAEPQAVMRIDNMLSTEPPQITVAQDLI